MAETFLYLTTIGRKSGEPHKIEIWYVADESCYYLCSEHRQQADWVKNIINNPSVRFYIAEREQVQDPQSGVATIITDESDIAIIAQKFNAKYKWSDGLFMQICVQQT